MNLGADPRDLIANRLRDELGVEPQFAMRLLTQAHVRGQALQQLARHVTEYDQPFTAVHATATPVVIRMSKALHHAGFTDVVMPACSDCRQHPPRLEPFDGRLLCRTCRTKSTPTACQNCGRHRPIYNITRKWCRACVRNDPDRKRPCSVCGEHALPNRVATDGTAICIRCYQAPRHACTGCGTLAAAAATTPDGALCYSCYRYPRQPCTTCGQLRRVNRRDRDLGLTVCGACARAEAATDCAACGHHRPIIARWPLGAVCRNCHDAIRVHPSPCTACGQTRILNGRTKSAEPICGPCADPAGDFTCRDCGNVGNIYARQRCTRCVLRRRLTRALSQPDGVIPVTVEPLIQAMLATGQHHPILRWLDRAEGAKLLRQLITDGRPISHDTLDALSQTRAAHHLRDLLTTVSVLVARDDEFLVRAERFTDQAIEPLPSHEAGLVRQFAHWHLLRRARHRARHSPPDHGTDNRLRAQIRAAINLLRWLAAQHQTLAALTQADLERWLEQTTSSHRASINAFVMWANRRRLTDGLHAPTRRAADPAHFLHSDERLRQLERCLDDQAIPLDVRVVAAFVLLFGIAMAPLLRLTMDDFIHDGNHMFLTVGAHRLQLPPALANMITKLGDHGPARESTLTRIGAAPPWLFISTKAGRPTTPSWMSNRLRRHGFTPMSGRNSARLSLAAEVPPAILASQTGISVGTATAWSQLTSRDWLEFIAARPQT
jgi:hypothetical protein